MAPPKAKKSSLSDLNLKQNVGIESHILRPRNPSRPAVNNAKKIGSRMGENAVGPRNDIPQKKGERSIEKAKDKLNQKRAALGDITNPMNIRKLASLEINSAKKPTAALAIKKTAPNVFLTRPMEKKTTTLANISKPSLDALRKSKAKTEVSVNVPSSRQAETKVASTSGVFLRVPGPSVNLPTKAVARMGVLPVAKAVPVPAKAEEVHTKAELVNTNQMETTTQSFMSLPNTTEATVSNEDMSLYETARDYSLMAVVEESSEVLHNDEAMSVDDETEAQDLEDEDQPRVVPEGVVDFDKEVEKDPFQIGIYAYDVFEYYREREAKYALTGYLHNQPQINDQMRAVLVDWMVEVQESFELNHETLYLAVKIVDRYLSTKLITRDELQLIGATSIFIACKYDERCAPLLDDFVYVCDDAYTAEQFLAMEGRILKILDFDLGIPLSYRFLRRYARCCRSSLETLTFARYMLEMSLMDHSMIVEKDSVVAAAALLLASVTKGLGGWNSTLEYYSGCSLQEVEKVAIKLHAVVKKKSKQNYQSIKNKYSHRVFHEVATIPIPDILKLESLQQ